jgi:hypothetical protein
MTTEALPFISTEITGAEGVHIRHPSNGLRHSPFLPRSGLHHCALWLLCPLLTSAHPSCRLLTTLAQWQMSRSPRVSRTHLLPIYLSHLLPRLPDDYRASDLIASSPRRGCLLCTSCSSGRGFAHRFLQTPPRSDSPCGSANGSRHQGP